MDPPKSFATFCGLFVAFVPYGIASNARFWKYQKADPCRLFVPDFVTVVISPGCPYSALLLTPSTRISEIDSAEGKASAWMLFVVWFCAEMPSTVVSDCEGRPP